MCWFSSQDGPDGPMGVKDNALRARPAYSAFKTMTQQLSSYKRANRIAGAAHPLAGIQAFKLDGAGDKKVVVWAASNASAAPPPAASAVDVFGASVPLMASMAFTGSPIYFTTTATDTELAAWGSAL
jgi:hypothetical protein